MDRIISIGSRVRAVIINILKGVRILFFNIFNKVVTFINFRANIFTVIFILIKIFRALN